MFQAHYIKAKEEQKKKKEKKILVVQSIIAHRQDVIF